MIKAILKRFLSLTLCVLMICMLLPVTAYAAGITGLDDTTIGLSADSNDTWTATGAQILGSVNGDGCNPSSTTLTITNSRQSAAKLMFDYDVTLNSGTVKIGDDPVTAKGSFEGMLNSNGFVTITLQSNSKDTSATSITITNIRLIEDKSVTVTFTPAENGSYTVNGIAVTENVSYTQSSLETYALAATPDDGYIFVGWYDKTNDAYFQGGASADVLISYDCEVTAKFTKAGTIFGVDSEKFDDLNTAINFAVSNGFSQVTLLEDYTLVGNYTIPQGVTLLIPYDAENTLLTTTPARGTVGEKQEPYKTLTMAEGASITVDGAISVGGKHYATSGWNACATTGAYGWIKMNEGSAITVNNGGKLYAWGYITGDGSITAESGATVYEYFQVRDWRGGNATFKMVNNESKVFPFSQYYVQNIESSLSLKKGAEERVFFATELNGSYVSAFVNFVGESGSMFAPDGVLTKRYDTSSDRMVFDIDGNAALNSIKLTVTYIQSLTVDSKKYVLPINNNVDLNVHSGTVILNQDVELLPGVNVTIDKDAEVQIAQGSSLYVYVKDQWGATYVWSSPNGITQLAYSPSWANGKAPSRTTSDARIDVNGKLTAAGSIYTTEGGADICSSQGTGVYVQQSASGTSTVTYQYNQSTSTYIEIPITPAKLHNADGSYTETANAAAGTTILYLDGVWGGAADITVDFDANGGEGRMTAWTGKPNTSFDLPKNTFTREGYSFTGWNTGKNGDGTPYSDQDKAGFAENTTLYAQWTVDPVITFVANDGEGTMGTQTVKPNVATALTANAFTRADYDFAGWNTAADGSGVDYADGADITTSENVTLYAQWTLHKYHVRWLNWDGTVLQQGDYTIEDTVSYEGDLPERPEDDDYTYKFKGWVPSDGDAPMDIHADTDYTAQFNQLKKLTVTFDANGGDGTMPSVKIASNSRYTLPECGFTREGYDFAGWLITGTVSDVFNEQYEVEDEPWGDTWLYAFSDLTLKASWEDNHSLTEIRDSREPTCTEKGYTGDTYCKVCNQVQKMGESIPAKGHSWGEGVITITPTCSGAGVKHYTCTVCAATKDEALDPTSHTPVDVAEQPATCTKQGHTAGTKCSVCDATISGIEEIPAAGHKEEIRNAKEATLTENGYTGDTYCSVCNELIANGEVIPKTGVTITWIVGDKTTTEVYEKGAMPSYDGEPTKAEDTHYTYTFTGWDKDLVAATEDETYTAQFAATGKNGLCTEDDGIYWLENGKHAEFPGLICIDVGTEEQPHYHYYYFGEDGKAVKDGNYKVDKNNGLSLPCYQYAFDEDGIIIHDEDTSKNGICDGDGSKFNYIDGVKVGEGLICVDGKYYYAKTASGEIVMNQGYWITKTNDLPVAAGMYHFDADGVMQINGFVTVNGGTYYHEKGTLVKGFAKIGDDYYFFNKVTGKMYKDANMWVDENGYGIKGGIYHFGIDGKMVDPDLVNGVKTIVTVDGDQYFTIDGVRMSGLYELNGEYYYADSTGKLVTSGSAYIGTDLLSGEGWYAFDETGKLIKTGFVTGGGCTYYYLDAVRAKDFTKIGEDYYFFNKASGKMYKNATLWVGADDDYGIEGGMYYFGADGKMVIPSEPDLEHGVKKIVEENGKLYFTIDDVRMYNGLYELDGNYYFAKYSGELAVNETVYAETALADRNGWYAFDETGKLIKNGFVTGGGCTYYYNDGVRAKGFMKIGDDYYFFNKASGKMYKDATLWVAGENTYGIEGGMHYFDADGKMANS